MRSKPIRLMNLMATAIAVACGVAVSPEALLNPTVHRLARQYKRNSARERRHASWPYCGPRQRARYARQVDRGQLRLENGLAVG